MKSIKAVSLLTAFLLIVSTSSEIGAQENNSNKFVTIVKVKAPAAATGDFIKQGFVKAIPTYRAIENLEFKASSLQSVDNGNVFGGIYLWKNKESAEKRFAPQWFARVKTTYGVDGNVDYYPVVADKSFVSGKFDYKIETAVTVLVQNLSEKDLKVFTKKSLGLFRSYFVKTAGAYGAILLFANEQTANLLVKRSEIPKFVELV